ncbi:radical SAM protein [Lacrimispora saccharolytica]|uniref:Radical SAM domain protein n=1 Tax=Lacrimispora saccharolytica (strain ATCC 35040 / DSM 2544 / NRCC 2533 / WM1) TaxID=610130 RepID=D9RA32_LACSW|nr:radical SAM protein [Lacrimispora saccharolytica]ADL06004.1 Radical SAM domain protein [[Clostridium] saccharolyticum WM1]QRV19870.1 radical SAM protein [Lacrimispora saccharolytica]
MSLIRAKTLDLKDIGELTEVQRENSRINREEALAGKTILQSYPRRIVLEMTSACNIHCKMCGRSSVEFKPTLFHKDWLPLLEPAADKIEEVTLLGWGEPTLHPHFREFLKWAKEHRLRKFFCTNGTRLRELKEDIFNNEVELLTVSLDGACAETNNQIRAGADFDSITSALKDIADEKKRRGVEFPYLSIVMTMMESNYREFPQYVRLGHELGLQEVKGVYLTAFDERMLDESLYGKQQELQEIFGEAERLGEKLGIAVKLPCIQGEDSAGDFLHKDCYTGWRDFFLGSDGYVRSCMSTSRKLFHISKYASFNEMWNSEEYQDFRKRVNGSDMDLPCKNCYQASFANWNKKSAFIQTGNDFAPKWEE